MAPRDSVHNITAILPDPSGTINTYQHGTHDKNLGTFPLESHTKGNAKKQFLKNRLTCLVLKKCCLRFFLRLKIRCFK